MTRAAALTRASAQRWPTSAVLWVVALAIMAGFQFWRGAPIDGVIFAVITSGLLIERSVRMRRPAADPAPAPRRSPFTPRLSVVVGVALAAGLALVLAPRTGAMSIALVAALGLAAVALVWDHAPGSRPSSPASRRRSRIAWGSIGIALCLWEAAAYILSVAVPRGWIGFPTVSLLLEPAVDFDPTRALLAAAWLAVGVWLVAGAAARRATPRAGARS
ncbi:MULTISPECIES: hypothetical protein [unclassified Microcella]|uniref:hypothetical protein n=1 Tax=unclassified Microcella TaxID=2630066 RepID=UPI0006FE1A70|nr:MULTISPECIES: hypothetical protein [unclassified Microcella]KQV25725.1 hypothetical protein ASC54_01680 [Yonghaparkia sp. Root332]KRF33465.1 hypothetical protein ASG83_05955 [Yonghaparkia sp. Soil809]